VGRGERFEETGDLLLLYKIFAHIKSVHLMITYKDKTFDGRRIPFRAVSFSSISTNFSL
jgi:hypothetical protein